MRVPLLDLQAQYRPIRGEVLAAIERVCETQRFILGPEVEAFERELARLVGVPFAVGVSSGTDALLAALMALKVGPGDEVITPTYSFFATAGCAVRLGARPVLVDIDPATFNVDAAAVQAAITRRTKAIMPVHLFGLMADMDAIADVAHAAAVPIVEDACQAIGAEFRGRPAGTIGTVACFSFFPSKNLGAFGDAGVLTTADERLAHDLTLLRNHGMEPKYYHHVVGGNFRLDALQAAVLRVKARHLNGWTEARRRNASRYRELLTAAGLTDRVALPVEPAHCRHIFNQYVVRVPDRDRLRAHLTERDVGTEIYYPVPFHLQPCFEPLGYRHGAFPEAERAAQESLALPIYGELTENQQEYVVQCIREFYDRRA